MKYLMSLLVLSCAMVTFSANAELPASAQRDRYMLALTKAWEQRNYADALKYIDKLDALLVKKSPDLDFFRGDALYHVNKCVAATEAMTRYVEARGQKGRFYEGALEVINECEGRVDEYKGQLAGLPIDIKTKAELMVKLLNYSSNDYESVDYTSNAGDDFEDCRWYYSLKSTAKLVGDNPGNYSIQVHQSVDDDENRICSRGPRRNFLSGPSFKFRGGSYKEMTIRLNEARSLSLNRMSYDTTRYFDDSFFKYKSKPDFRYSSVGDEYLYFSDDYKADEFNKYASELKELYEKLNAAQSAVK